MHYDECLNHKSIMDCEHPLDESQHAKDSMKIWEVLSDKAPAGAFIKKTYMDRAHKEEEPNYRYVPADKYADVLQSEDLKNGVDAVIHNDNFGCAVHGQNYYYKGETAVYHVEALVSYRFIDPNQFDALKPLLEEMDEMNLNEANNFAKDLFETNRFGMNDTNLKDALRGIKNLPLDIQIKNAQEKQTNHLGKGKEKTIQQSLEPEI